MDFATEVIISFGVAQVRAGADLPIVFDPFASPAVIPHQFFREFEFPRLKTVFESFRRAGTKANWLHIAGPAEQYCPSTPRPGSISRISTTPSRPGSQRKGFPGRVSTAI